MSGRRTSRGFTVIELLVIIVVIGILAGLLIVGYSRVTAQGRDSRRMSDLAQIADAITAYRLRYGDPVTNANCAGAGNGSGNGWFNYVGSGYTTSILTCLTNKGYLSDKYVDPTGCATTGGAAAPGRTCTTSGYAYMKSTSTEGGATVTYLMARLELKGNVADLKVPNDHCSSDAYATSYNMNYMIKVE